MNNIENQDKKDNENNNDKPIEDSSEEDTSDEFYLKKHEQIAHRERQWYLRFVADQKKRVSNRKKPNKKENIENGEQQQQSNTESITTTTESTTNSTTTTTNTTSSTTTTQSNSINNISLTTANSSSTILKLKTLKSNRGCNLRTKRHQFRALIGYGEQSNKIKIQTTYKVIPDEIQHIQAIITQWTHLKFKLILTTGGTGFSNRDVTPEAVQPLLDREAPGIVVAMLKSSLDVTPHAMLSRPVAGIKDLSLIVTLPGSVKAVRENLSVILPALPHAISLINSNPKTPVSEAIDIILSQCRNNLDTIQVPILESLGMIVAEDIIAKEPFPSFRASIKDGYAIQSKDGIGKYRILGDSLAGTSNYVDDNSNDKKCVRITTGAKIPDQFDSVVMVEETELVDDGLFVNIEVSVRAGADIRPIGSDISVGSIILKKGEKIGTPEIGLLSTIGQLSVTVYKPPSISIISTGDELLPYDTKQTIPDGFIRDSNSPTLQTLISEFSNQFGVVADRSQVKSLGIIKDKTESLETVLSEATKNYDIIITSGGVSMGQLDLVKPLLEKMGKVHFGRVNMKPGKPFTFATIESAPNKKTLVFALPGNPVSTIVTFFLFVTPALKKLSGYSNFNLPTVQVKLGEKLRLDPERPEYHRCCIEWNFEQNCFISSSTGSQASCRLLSMKNANAMLLLPQKDGFIEKGEFVNALIIGPLI
eukprot:gene8387-10302_t